MAFQGFEPKPITPKPVKSYNIPYNNPKPNPYGGIPEHPSGGWVSPNFQLGGNHDSQPMPMDTGGTQGWWTLHGGSWGPSPVNLPTWDPSFDQGFIDFLGQYRGSVSNLLQNPTGMTPEEQQALTAQALEGIGNQAQNAYQASLENAARMGLVGSPVGGQLPQAVAYQQAKQVADFERQLTIERERRKQQAVYQAQQAAAQYSSIASNWENIKNKYGEDAAKMKFQKALTEWNMRMKAAEASMQAQLAEERVNAARRGELYNLINYLGGFGARQQNYSYRNAALQWNNYWNELNYNNQQQQLNNQGWGNLGALGAYGLSKLFGNNTVQALQPYIG